MGINWKDLELLIHLRQQKHIPANRYVVELDAQQLSNSFLRSEDLVRKAEALFSRRLGPPGVRAVVLRHMRRDVEGSKIGDMLGRVIGLVLAGGDAAANRSGLDLSIISEALRSAVPLA
jgi:hypothetical protein